MNNSIFKILAMLILGGGLSFATEVSVGQEIAILETKSGRRYEQVKVRAILPDGLKIMHSSGSATLPASELPQFEQVFSRIQPETVKMLPVEPPASPAIAPASPAVAPASPAVAPASPAVAPASPAVAPAWLPKTNSDVADCSLFVNVTKKYSADGTIGAGSGTAFLCNQGRVTYIYSNAHNFDGTIEFTIVDRNGTKYDDFVSIETAANGCGLWKEHGVGGDVVRIRLKNYREKALTIDPAPVSQSNGPKRRILVTGNTGGRGTITQLEGVITDIADDHIIKHNAATEGGNSGSPIVDMETWKVIGILTWGTTLPDALKAIWTKQADEVREGLNTGAGLATISFSDTTFDHLQKQRLVMNQLKKNVRLLGLLDTLVPAKQGIFVDKSAIVMGDYTVDDLLQESSDHPVVVELVRLNGYLATKANSNIGMNNQDMLKLYTASYKKCLDHISSLRSGIENSNSATYFMKCKLKQSRMLEISKAYESLTARSLQWYITQRGTGGTSMPIDDRLRLPALRSGLEGLGIKDK